MSRLTLTMRRYALLALPVLAAVGLLVAGCGNYTEKNVSPLPRTVSGSTTASGTATTSESTSSEAATTEATTSAEATTTAEATTSDAGAAEGDAAAGKSIFTSAGCSACHTLKDAGASGAVGPNLDDTKPAAALVTDRVTNGKGAMPGFKGRLSDSDIANVAAYVSSVAGK